MRGGSAFPSPGVVLHTDSVDERQQGAYEGMTLRDYFAAKAMQAMAGKNFVNEFTIADDVKTAYCWADAMIAERAK